MSADDDDRRIDPAFHPPVDCDPGTLEGFPDPPAMGCGGGPASAPRDLKERYRRAITFLQRARDLPELSPVQIDRIERRLQEQPARPVRRLLLSPALAVLIVLLLAGGALAMAGRDRTWLSGIGHWLRARGEQPGAPAPHPAIRPPRAEAPAIAASPAATNEAAPTPPTPAIAPSEAPIPAARAVDRPSHTLEPSHARRARVALAPTRDDRVRGPAAKLPARPEVPSEEPAPPALVQPPPAAPQAETSSAPAATRATLPASPAPERTTPPAAAHVPVPVAEANPIVAESRSFASALERWHRDQDAGAALAMLDVQERRFPSGQLGLEARLLRVEILLASRRESDALALLDHMGIAGVPRARELRTVRGELRIKLGRCADGRADLNAVLAAGTADPLAQRARRAIAACP